MQKISRRNFLKLVGASAAASTFMSPFDPLRRVYAQNATNITFGGWGGVAEDEGVKAAIEVFQKENSNITVEWQHTPDAGEYGTVLLTNIAAGTAPDTSFILSDHYETLRKDGALLDITDRISSDKLLGKPNYFMAQEAARCADNNGRWHGIGSCWVAHHLYYNAQIFEEAGLTPPGFGDDEIWDWDTFVNICKQLTVDANGRHPDDAGFDKDNIQRWAIDWPKWWMPVGAAVHSNGGSYLTADGLYGLDSPEAIEAMQRLSDLTYVHNVAPRSATLTDLGMNNTQMIESGRLAMGADGSWALSWMNPSLLKVPMGTGALPKMKQPASIMQAHFHSVLASSQHPDEAWQWVRFLSTPFYQTQFLKIGLWIPSQTDLLTPEGLSTWVTEGVHPANYPQFVTEYLPKYGVPVRLPAGNIEASNDYITPAWDAIFAGEPAEKIMPDAVKAANEVIMAARE